MGRFLLLIVMGVTFLFSTVNLMLNRHRIDLVDKNSEYVKFTMARNCATSGAYMALSKLSFDENWMAGFQGLTLNNGQCNVVIQDENTNAALSSMERIVSSTGTFEDVVKTVDVQVGIPPDLGGLAAFTTGPIVNVSTWDEADNPDSTLAIENAPFMLPFDFETLESMAESQGHVIVGDFTPDDGYPNGSFYYDGVNPNVTKITGDFIAVGGRICYGIYVVYGNAILNGNSRLDGVITCPDPSSIVIYGGGDPKEASITGGVFINGAVDGTGNHIHLKYDSEFMDVFSDFQIQMNLYVIKWLESPSI